MLELGLWPATFETIKFRGRDALLKQRYVGARPLACDLKSAKARGRDALLERYGFAIFKSSCWPCTFLFLSTKTLIGVPRNPYFFLS